MPPYQLASLPLSGLSQATTICSLLSPHCRCVPCCRVSRLSKHGFWTGWTRAKEKQNSTSAPRRGWQGSFRWEAGHQANRRHLPSRRRLADLALPTTSDKHRLTALPASTVRRRPRGRASTQHFLPSVTLQRKGCPQHARRVRANGGGSSGTFTLPGYRMAMLRLLLRITCLNVPCYLLLLHHLPHTGPTCSASAAAHSIAAATTTTVPRAHVGILLPF